MCCWRFYYAGLRVSELCDLRWRDVQPHGGSVVLAIHGKGQKTRFVKLKDDVAAQLQQLRDEHVAPDVPVFRSRKKGGALVSVQVFRIVKAAALRAGLPAEVCPHWLRHAHASHALDRGAPISLVQATLGHASVQTTGKYTHARPNDSSSRYLP
jgi:integrase/recombinase XerD